MDNKNSSETDAPNFRKKLTQELCKDGREKDFYIVCNLAISKYLTHFDKSEHEEKLKEISTQGTVSNLLFLEIFWAKALEEYAISINYDTNNEILSVEKEPKTFRPIEQTSKSYICGFDLTFEELTDYYTQESGWETSKIENMLELHKEMGIKKYQVRATVERRFKGDGGWYLLFGDFSECTLNIYGLSETGELNPVNLDNRKFKSLFNFFDFEYMLTIWKIVESAKNAFKATDKARLPEMAEDNIVTAEVEISELSDEGKEVIRAIRRQSEILKGLLYSKKGIINANIWEAGDAHSENVLAVKVISELTPKKRGLYYGGIEGIDESDVERIYSKSNSLPFETKDFIKKVKNVQEDLDVPLACRTFYVPRKHVEMYLQGKLTGADVINALGDTVIIFCDQFRCKLA